MPEIISGNDSRKFKTGSFLKIMNDMAAPMNGADANSVLALAEPISFNVKIKRNRLIP